MSELDIFIRNSIYLDASSIFSADIRPISEIKDDCIFVLDTNALLLPYYTNSQDLTEIEKVLSLLVQSNRLFIPGQVAREFAANRPERIKEVFQTLNQQLNIIKEFKNVKSPLLGNIPEYNELNEIEKQFNSAAKTYRDDYKKKLNEVLQKIKDWTWNDPVSVMYKSLFTEDRVFDPPFDKEEIKKELQRRYAHKLPPGYKDAAKADEGIGDFLIWYAILELGKQFKKHVVFISGEEKADWLYKSEGQTLYPRFELVSEYMTASEGKSFHLIRFSTFLELMAGNDKMVKDIEQIEQHFSNKDFRKAVNDFSIWIEKRPSPLSNPTSALEIIDKEKGRIIRAVTVFLSLDNAAGLKPMRDFIDSLRLLFTHEIIDYEGFNRLLYFFISDEWQFHDIDKLFDHITEIKHLRLALEMTLDRPRK
jgi:hypothetical protein